MIGSPNIFIMVLWVWPAVAVALFAFMPPRRALAAGLVIGWLFLPMFGFGTPFVKFDKHTATSLGAVLGVLIFDTSSLFRFRPALIDLPIVVWCFMPFAASVSNGLSQYDGMASSATQLVVWGVPWFLGRMYYGDFLGTRGLGVWIFVAGLIYAPLCIYESVMSPQLHMMVYGFHQHDFSQVIRMGGWRPMAFMQHGIALANLMTAASLAGIWLWWTGSLRTLLGMPAWLPLIVVLGATAATRSAGAIALLAGGLGALLLLRVVRTHLVVVALCVLPMAYMTARSVAGWDGQSLVQFVEQTFERDRALSLQCRFDNENLLLEKALKKPYFGWGPNGRNLVTREDGTIESIPDGLWVFAIGAVGIVGLVALYASLLLPVLLVRQRIPLAMWNHPLVAGVAVLSILVVLHAIDNLMNSMLNPLFILGLGGLAGIVARAPGQAATPVTPVRRAVAAPHRTFA